MANKDYKKEKREAFDALILSAYKLGWTDCFGGDKSNEMLFKNNSILQIAWNSGWIDYVVGDDVTSVDLQTDKEILEQIKFSHTQYLKNQGKEGSYEK